MSRVIPAMYQSLDYSLWEEVQSHASLANLDDIEKIALDDGWTSSKSKYWLSEGRRTLSGDVIDFIGLSSNFTNLDQMEFLSESIIDEIKERVSRLPGGDRLFDFNNKEEWLQINWPILSKVIGAAIASAGQADEFWSIKGTDAMESHKFWSDVRKIGKRGSEGTHLSYEEWNKLLIPYLDRGLDPISAVLRGQSHAPSSPMIVHGEKYYANPLADWTRKEMKRVYPTLESAGEYRDYHGKLTFELIRNATRKLSEGKIADFLFEINGICAYHVMREGSLIQQKIGLHLVTNLAIRKITRGVGCVPVPDIASVLDTGFRLGAVLSILNQAGLIDWYTVEADRVHGTISDIRSR